ncbi:MAG: hypothetical protein LWY06_20600 [Firmicutes bacterium]|nr:hypothetical protein [Bacillota bacterium]
MAGTDNFMFLKNRSLALFILLFFFSMATACSNKAALQPSVHTPSPPAFVQDDFRKVREEISRGNFNKAEKLLSGMKEKPESYYFYGVIERGRGNYKKSAGYFQKALVVDPNNFSAKKFLAYDYFYDENMTEAEKIFLGLLKVKADDCEVCYGIALTCYRLGKMKEAHDFAEKAMNLELALKNPDAEHEMDGIRNQGRLVLLQNIIDKKDKEKVITLARRDLEARKSDPQMLSEYAILMYDYGETEQSRKIIEDSLKKADQNQLYVLHRVYGEFWEMEKEYANAEKEYKTASQLAPVPGDVMSAIELAALYLQYGGSLTFQDKFDQAEKTLKKTLDYVKILRNMGNQEAADENLANYYTSMAQLEVERNRLDKADVYLKKAEEIQKTKLGSFIIADLVVVRASWFNKQGEYKKALNILTNLLHTSPKSMDEIYFAIAGEYCLMKDGADALKCIRKSIALNGNRRRIEVAVAKNRDFDFIRNLEEYKKLVK